MSLETDYIIIGSGIAGLRAAIEIAASGARVTVLTKDRTSESNTEYAQGGVAVALSEDDEVALHEDDTIAAGAGLCDAEAVRVLVEDGKKYITELIEWGTEFDREEGHLMFTQEAAHSRRRILHSHGDSTGKEIVRALIARAGAIRNISFLAHAATESLLIDGSGACAGVRYLDPLVRATRDITARAVVLASGGAGALFLHTTNPNVATGDGMAMAYAAGAELADMEFVQFHPTALMLENAPRFLLSEAMRGEGGILRNADGEAFMRRYHTAAELAPRDIVSRSIVREVERTAGKVYLDMTMHSRQFLERRFPKIYETCRHFQLDLAREPIPVSPAAHYIMGGVRTDLHGRTTVPRLYAAGEVACTGVHGANRLASNSLLEGLVFGARAGRAVLDDAESYKPSKDTRYAAPDDDTTTNHIHHTSGASGSTQHGEIALAVLKRVRRLMWERVGITRTRSGLQRALNEFEQIGHARLRTVSRNFLSVATLVARAALWREESRGGHFRDDFPHQDDEHWQVHSIQQRDAQIASSAMINFEAESPVSVQR
ncbi:MAG: L-aspartate oxidase [Pyrinomonadaceae bacterium MAG19_C2-C3]|nr:L-aspartate oxidase [Pyrinomonadaceae bacterium MAG19_C2-C3]